MKNSLFVCSLIKVLGPVYRLDELWTNSCTVLTVFG